MNSDDILIRLGRKIYNHFLQETSPGAPFLLIIEPTEYEKIKKEVTGNITDVDNALKSTGSLNCVPSSNYISIAVANFQVQWIYNIAVNQINDGFYTAVKKYYQYLSKNTDILSYFEKFQEEMWEKVRDIFAKENRELKIPERKGPVSGRYVQYPKSQRLITWKELSKYADVFLKTNLEPNQVLPFSDFCEMVRIEYNHNFDSEQNLILKKIVFSFYCNWDGSSTEELRIPKGKKSQKKFYINRAEVLKNNRFPLRVETENKKLVFYDNEIKVSEQDVNRKFKNEHVLSFLYDDKYQDWIHTTRPLSPESSLLVLVEKSHYWDATKFKRHFYTKLGLYDVYRFETCNKEIADFAKLRFEIKKEYFKIIGGIRAINCYHYRNDVLGAWYDFALPKIKLNFKDNTRIFIDSKEIIAGNNFLDLANLTFKENYEKKLEPREKEYSLKCTDLPPVYFRIESSESKNIEPVQKGWKISANSMRPIKPEESPDFIGLLSNFPQISHSEKSLRPFLSKSDYLHNRLSNVRLNESINRLEKRRIYGI